MRRWLIERDCACGGGGGCCDVDEEDEDDDDEESYFHSTIFLTFSLNSFKV